MLCDVNCRAQDTLKKTSFNKQICLYAREWQHSSPVISLIGTFICSWQQTILYVSFCTTQTHWSLKVKVPTIQHEVDFVLLKSSTDAQHPHRRAFLKCPLGVKVFRKVSLLSRKWFIWRHLTSCCDGQGFALLPAVSAPLQGKVYLLSLGHKGNRTLAPQTKEAPLFRLYGVFWLNILYIKAKILTKWIHLSPVFVLLFDQLCFIIK